MKAQNRPKRESKKPKHMPTTLRDSQRAKDANIYSDGFQHGYQMGMAEGARLSCPACSQRATRQLDC